MATETPPDPTLDAWSERLEQQLAEAGMEQAQARAYRLAFELGLTRVISQTATRQELKDEIAAVREEIAAVRQDLKDGLRELKADLRSEMRFLFLLFGGLTTPLLAAILAIVA